VEDVRLTALPALLGMRGGGINIGALDQRGISTGELLANEGQQIIKGGATNGDPVGRLSDGRYFDLHEPLPRSPMATVAACNQRWVNPDGRSPTIAPLSPHSGFHLRVYRPIRPLATLLRR
jgi:hypothetical protein